MLKRVSRVALRRRGLCIVPSATAAMRSHHYRGATATDPFGESASWDSHPGVGSRGSKTINPDAFEEAMEAEATSGRHFGEGPMRERAILRAAYGASLNTVDRKTQDKIAGAFDGLDAEEIAERKADIHTQRKQEREKHMMSKNYSSYEEFAARELAQEAADEDEDMEDDEEDMDGEAAQEEEADVLDARSASGAEGPANFTGSSIPISLRDDAPRDAYEFQQEGVPKSKDVRYHDTHLAVKELVQNDNPMGAKDVDDPLNWDTDDVIDWLQHYAPDAMDESMESAFRMVRVNGDMLLNRVTVPVLFKEMRRWHVKTKKGEFYEPKLSNQMVQEAVYMCYPYCRF